jgi:hypothetical protein
MANNLLKSVLALGKTAEAAKWVEAEREVIGRIGELSSESIVPISVHFAQNAQGSNNFWSAIEQGCLRNFNKLNGKDIVNLSRVFIGISDKYEASSDFEDKLLTSLNYVSQEYQRRKTRDDPYYLAKLNESFERFNNFNSTLAEAQKVIGSDAAVQYEDADGTIKEAKYTREEIEQAERFQENVSSTIKQEKLQEKPYGRSFWDVLSMK